jgi:dolichyl-phosphate beta-glucosyltransferase
MKQERRHELARMTNAECVLVVPCYNEAARFHADSFAAFLQAQESTRFLFVNDGSSDGSLQVLQKFCAEHSEHASVLDLQPNRGKGEAVRLGMLHVLANSPESYAGFWDADLATPLDALPEFLEVLERDPEIDMVFGSRIRLLGRHVSRNPMRHYAGRIFATTVSVSLGLPIYDTQCGAKIFRPTPLFLSVLATPFESRWIFDVELLARFLAAWKHTSVHPERKIYELPLQTWVDVAGSKLRSTDFIRSFTDLVKIRREFLRLQRHSGVPPR